MTQDEFATIKEALLNAVSMCLPDMRERQNKAALKIITQEQLRQKSTARVAAAISPLQDEIKCQRCGELRHPIDKPDGCEDFHCP